MKPNTLKSIRRTLVSGLLAVALSVASLTSHAAPITKEAAHAIGMDAYVYFYSLLSMDVTRKQFTNIEAGKEFGKGPMNMWCSRHAVGCGGHYRYQRYRHSLPPFRRNLH